MSKMHMRSGGAADTPPRERDRSLTGGRLVALDVADAGGTAAAKALATAGAGAAAAAQCRNGRLPRSGVPP